MPANPASMVQPRPHEFQHLLTSVTGPDARSQTASPVELPLFRRLLALGAALWRLCLVTWAVVRPAAPVPAPDGTRLTGHDQRPTIDDAVFGNGSFARHAFTAPGQSGSCALDAELSLPAHGYADLLREWAVSGTPDESSRERQTVRDRILGRSRRVQARETCAAEAGAEVTPVDEQPAEPMAEAPLGTILVVPADGTGGPMVPPPTQRLPVRLGQGQQRGQKQAAVVTGLSTMAPYPRTPQEVVAALLQEPGGPEPAGRPRPEGKELRATREGQAVAMSRLAPRVAQRAGPQIQPRGARTEGAAALPQPVVRHGPEHTLGRAIIHATESRWDTATALRGETHPQRPAWVRAYWEPLLAGQTDAVITALAAEGKDPTWTGTPRHVVRRTVGSYRRHRPDRHDDEYLARGWPMGTGGGEGACGHLVNDRLEPSGMRWTTGGAQAGLDLRAVRSNGHGEAYGPFHRHPHHQRRYGPSAPAQASAEAQALEWAA